MSSNVKFHPLQFQVLKTRWTSLSLHSSASRYYVPQRPRNRRKTTRLWAGWGAGPSDSEQVQQMHLGNTLVAKFSNILYIHSLNTFSRALNCYTQSCTSINCNLITHYTVKYKGLTFWRMDTNTYTQSDWLICYKRFSAIGHVRYINIRAWLRGFRVKIANFSSFLLSLNSQKRLRYKENNTK